MLITISGVITDKLEQSLVIETGSIGYQLWVTPHELDTAGIGEKTKFWVYESIREDAHDLYGFNDYAERSLFTQLLSVSGVGPKAALSILSVAGFGDVRQAIANGDIALLQSAPGVGKRTAERIVVELRTSIGITAGVENAGSETDAALEALQSLGYSRSASAQALAGVSQDLSDEDRIKEALKEIK